MQPRPARSMLLGRPASLKRWRSSLESSRPDLLRPVLLGTATCAAAEPSWPCISWAVAKGLRRPAGGGLPRDGGHSALRRVMAPVPHRGRSGACLSSTATGGIAAHVDPRAGLGRMDSKLRAPARTRCRPCRRATWPASGAPRQSKEPKRPGMGQTASAKPTRSHGMMAGNPSQTSSGVRGRGSRPCSRQ